MKRRNSVGQSGGNLRDRTLTTSQGFTLIEVLLAITALSIMLTLSYSTISSLLSAKSIIEDEQEIERLELVLIKRLSRELQLATAGIAIMPPPDETETQYTSADNLIGERNELPNGLPGDSITFIGLNAGQNFLEDRPAQTGLVQISYSLKQDPERAPQEDYPVYSLIREEVPYERPFNEAFQKAVRFPLVDTVESLSFEYFDMATKEWSRTWGDAQKKELPAMVRCTIKVRTPRAIPKTISVTVPLRAKRQPQRR
jgi:prepilin-type N-terminal cleavage/methylation domain-containing protein